MNDQEPTSPDVPADAAISSPARAPVRLLGSHSSPQPFQAVALKKPPTDDEEPDEPPPPPPPPPPPVSTPDLALQISFCLPPELNSGIVSAIRDALGGSPDVRTACVNGSQRIGVWLRPAVSTSDNQARDRGLQRINVLGAGESLTFFINAAMIRRQANDAWNAQPKRLNGEGRPDPDGPIHLTGFSLQFQSPNRVVTRVDGFDERPWPDVDFHLSVTDTLSVSGSEVQCSSQRDLDVDTGWLNFLTGLFLLVLPPLGIVFLVERIIIASVDTPDGDEGPGCAAAALIPREILIPLGQKVVASYSRLEVSNGGIFAGGSFVVVPRAPEVTIVGPTQISIVEGTTSLTRSYSARTVDLRPPLRFAWSGDGTPTNPSAGTTPIRFSLPNSGAGAVVTKRVAVRVTDADGLAATDESMVRVHFTPEDDDTLPPVCKVKPWLPQCEAPLARAAARRKGDTT